MDFSRLLIIDNGMTPGQAGRNLQRLVEIEAYRMLALLAFPLARARMGELNKLESELRDATTALVRAAEAEEAHLLERLTHLAAAIENLQSASQFRFAAAASYHELVERRIDELREDRLEGLQTFSEFFDRRLQPAMRTCRVVVERQADLSARVARTTELLSTRVEISSQRQSHALLDSMDRRAQLQLRLQETVEGLSVAAITYYIVSLVGKGAEALGAAGLKVDPAISMGVAIPIVALIVAIGVCAHPPQRGENIRQTLNRAPRFPAYLTRIITSLRRQGPSTQGGSYWASAGAPSGLKPLAFRHFVKSAALLSIS